MSKQEQNETFWFYNIRERIAFWNFLKTKNDIEFIDFSNWKGFDKWDALIYSGNTKAVKHKYVVEIKLRQINSTKYPSIYIEKNKIQTLGIDTSESDEPLKKLMFMFFNDCIAVWDISNAHDFKYYDKMLRAHSVNNEKEKELKTVCDFYLKDCIAIIPYKIDYKDLWQRTKNKFYKLFNKQFDDGRINGEATNSFC